MGFFTYIRNWRVTNGHYPSSKKDTEQIFIEILKTRVKYKQLALYSLVSAMLKFDDMDVLYMS